jgi:hypothetical protein
MEGGKTMERKKKPRRKKITKVRKIKPRCENFIGFAKRVRRNHPFTFPENFGADSIFLVTLFAVP